MSVRWRPAERVHRPTSLRDLTAPSLPARHVFSPLLLLLSAMCAEPPQPLQEDYTEQSSLAEVWVEETEPEDHPPAISDAVPANSMPTDRRDREPAPVLPASHGDDDYANEQMVQARRYVYRVRMVVPGGLGGGRVQVAVPAAELHVDISHERLRARFRGTGWPVPPDSEIRLRRDRPGVYLFDGDGGRPLEPGELATWFEGGPMLRRGPPLHIFSRYGFPRRARIPDDELTPGELMCALLAELAAEPREPVLRRCELGAPHLFRFGFWRAEQTAGVPLELPRSALRADERDPPRPIAPFTSRPWLEAAALARLRGGRPPEETTEGAPRRGLRIENESAVRTIIAVDGVAVGWVDAGAQLTLEGLEPGTYDVGSIRPHGAVVQRGRPVGVPGVHRVCDGRCPRRTPPR